VLCREVSLQLESCQGENLTWSDLGATGRVDFVNECGDDWNQVEAQLSSNELGQALDVCADTTAELDEVTCAELISLYASRR